MEQYTDLIILFSGITVVFLGALISKKSVIFITFLLRGILCALVIYFTNIGLAATGLSIAVGFNSASLLTCAILGFPGLLLLYGIKIYKSL